jgi:integrase/recombinase XerD
VTRKKATLTVSDDLSDLYTVESQQTPVTPTKETVGMSVQQALTTVLKQMVTTGHRERTMTDYELHVSHFVKVTGVKHLADISADWIYEWLASMEVSNQTKLTRLKCLKAFLGRCFDNGWLTSKFWRNIVVKVDSPIKEGAEEKDVYTLLTLLDMTDFVQLRDAAALLLIFQTGIRIGTLSNLTTKHIDMDDSLLKIDGGLLKNHQQMYLPFDSKMKRLLVALIAQNDRIRKESQINNDRIFITMYGDPISVSPTNNMIRKRFAKYSVMYGLPNINPHALRRGFAKRLLNKGAHIAFISKALGHSDIAVTTRYLHIDKEEVANNLRNYL